MLWFNTNLVFLMGSNPLLRPALAVLVFFLCQYFGFSQSTKFSGYFIDLSGDTIRGSFPKYREWNYNPDRFTFIMDKEQAELELTPVFNNGQFVLESRFKFSPVVTLGINPGVNIVDARNLKFALMPGFNFAVLSKNIQTDETRVAVTGIVNRLETELAHNSSFANIQAQLIILNRFGLWDSYNFSMSITNYDLQYSRLSSVQIGAGVKF